jgi:hypothetical protein
MKTLRPCIMLGTCVLRFGAAFVGRTSTSSIGSRRIASFTRQGKTLVSLRAAAEEPSTTTSSYDIDTDEDVEQRLGENSVVLKPIQTNGGGDDTSSTFRVKGSNGGEGRYDDLLASVGLQNKLRHVGDLPEKRSVSVYDIFCNRELALGGINAIGFDMDYVSYTQ